MQESEHSWASVDPDAVEGLVGRATDGDVVQVSRHPVGTEREHDIWSFVTQKTCDSRDKLVERHLVKLSVRIFQPVVPVREVPHGTPRALVLVPAVRPQSLSRGGNAGCDLSCGTISGVQDAEPKSGVIRMKGN
jgi:hypothetical protein